MEKSQASSKPMIDPSQLQGFSRVLQDQEVTTLRGTFDDRNESDTAQRPVAWQDEEKIDIAAVQRKFGSENWSTVPRNETAYSDLLPGFLTSSDSHGLCSSFLDPTPDDPSPLKKHFQDQEGKFNLLSSPWSAMPSNPSLNTLDSSLKTPAQASEISFQKPGGGYGYSLMQGLGVECPGNWLMPLLPPSPSEHTYLPRGVKCQPISLQHHQAVKPNGDGNCRLFGIHLNNNPVLPESAQQHSSATFQPESHPHSTLHHLHSLESDVCSEPSKGTKLVDTALAGHELEKCFQTQQLPTDVQSKFVSGSTRSCTKVHKQGIALGRSVDLMKFNNYDELIAELDWMFEFDGKLMPPNKNWLIVYTDNEGDMMLVGDDPWQEFCSMVCKIFIYTRDEVWRMSPGTLNARTEEIVAVSEQKETTNESKSVPASLVANPENC